MELLNWLVGIGGVGIVTVVILYWLLKRRQRY